MIVLCYIHNASTATARDPQYGLITHCCSPISQWNLTTGNALLLPVGRKSSKHYNNSGLTYSLRYVLSSQEGDRADLYRII